MTKTATSWRWFDGSDPARLMARSAFVLCGVIAAITLVAALRLFVPLLETPSAAAAPPSTDAIESRWSPAIEEEEAEILEPVRVANQLDESEIFEFPHGTTLSEARAAIAEMLMERARERYAQLDARAPRS